MVKEEFKYSTPCKTVKTKAKIVVITNPYKAPILLPFIIQWWAKVTVIPEHNNNIVLYKGNSNGLIGSIPLGDQRAPNSNIGDIEPWKKVQKIAKKNKASLTINKPTPIFKPLCTAKVWLPWYVASHITSLNQKDIELTNVMSAIYKKFCPLTKPCIVKTPEVVSVKSEILV